MKGTWLAGIAALLFACSSGVGPIGIASIGGREEPGNSAVEPAHPSTPATSPPDTNDGDDNTNTAVDAGVNPREAFVQACVGTYDCMFDGGASTIVFRRTGAGCTADVAGVVVSVSANGTLADDGGVSAGTWTYSPGGAFVVVSPDQSKTTTCIVSSSSSSNDGGS